MSVHPKLSQTDVIDGRPCTHHVNGIPADEAVMGAPDRLWRLPDLYAVNSLTDATRSEKKHSKLSKSSIAKNLPNVSCEGAITLSNVRNFGYTTTTLHQHLYQLDAIALGLPREGVAGTARVAR